MTCVYVFVYIVYVIDSLNPALALLLITHKTSTEKIFIYDNIQYPNESYKFRCVFSFFFFLAFIKRNTYIALLLTLNLLQNLTILLFCALCVVCFCDGEINDNFRFDEICFNKPFYSLCVHFMCSRNSLRIHFLYFILFRSYQFQHKYVIPIEPIHWCVINVKRVRVCLVWRTQNKAYGKKSVERTKGEEKIFVWKWIVLIFAGHSIRSACVRIIDKINPWQPNYTTNHSILFRECDMATSHPTSTSSLSFCVWCGDVQNCSFQFWCHSFARPAFSLAS